MVDRIVTMPSVIGFYAILALFLGLIGGELQPSDSFDMSAIEEPGLTNLLDVLGFFFAGLFFSVSVIPFWANVILFTPLTIAVLVYVIDVINELIPG